LCNSDVSRAYCDHHRRGAHAILQADYYRIFGVRHRQLKKKKIPSC
jgi:hypothetical protein